MSLTSADAGVVLDELVVALIEVVKVEPGTVVLVVTVLNVATVLVVIAVAGTVIGTATITGALLQLAIVSDAVEKSYPAAAAAAAAFWYLTAASGIGTVSLSLLTDTFRNLDWAPVAAVAYEMAYATTIEPLSKLPKA